MCRKFACWSVALLGFGSAGLALGQPPGNPGGQRGPGGPGGDMMRMMPVMAALDANGDGEISAEEITKSVAALNGLDKNKDGKLTMDELRPDFAGRGGERGGPGGERGGRGPGGPEGDSAGLVARLMALDKNQDGKLAKDEVEGRLLGVFERADADQDGFVTKQEIEKLASTSVEGDQRRGGPGEGGPGGGPGRGPGGFGGPPNPEQYVNRAFEFDADKDGKLSKEELAKMISEAPFGGGRGPGRPDGERGEGRRPARPESE